MDMLWKSLQEAGRLLLEVDPLVYDATLRSIWITGTAIAFAAAAGLPLGTLLARKQFIGRRFLVAFCRAGMAVPTVFVGLVCFALFSRQGPLGSLQLIYTPYAIMFGELLLALPIVTSICHGSISTLDPRLGETAKTLGAGPLRRWGTYLSEARVGVTLAILTAFARCVTELGIAMIVGGNIPNRTRTLATATAMETDKGEFERGVAMGLILLLLALLAALSIGLLSRRTEK